MPKGITINRREYATVSWAIEDVAGQLGVDLCDGSDIEGRQRCHDALRYAEQSLRHRIVDFGYDMLSDLVEEFKESEGYRWVAIEFDNASQLNNISPSNKGSENDN